MHKSKSTGTLLVIATPIGNLGDLSLRAAEALKAADLIACEDTRTSSILLRHYGIPTQTTPYHEHNGEAARPRLLARLEAGETVALISDAGTPLISDPGYKLVRQAQERGIPVVSIPGPCSVTAALSVSGLPTDSFYFGGFLPHKSSARRQVLDSLQALPATLVFLESPNRLLAALKDIAEVLGEREVCVARELTKKFEEARRGSVHDMLTHYTATPAKGEIVLVIEGRREPVAQPPETLDAVLATLLQSHPLKEAVALAVEQTGAKRKEAYARALALKPHE